MGNRIILDIQPEPFKGYRYLYLPSLGLPTLSFLQWLLFTECHNLSQKKEVSYACSFLYDEPHFHLIQFCPNFTKVVIFTQVCKLGIFINLFHLIEQTLIIDCLFSTVIYVENFVP